MLISFKYCSGVTSNAILNHVIHFGSQANNLEMKAFTMMEDKMLLFQILMSFPILSFKRSSFFKDHHNNRKM